MNRKLSRRRERHPRRQTVGVAPECAQEVSRISRQTGIGARRLDWLPARRARQLGERRRRKAEHAQKNSTRTKRQSSEDAWSKDAGLRSRISLHGDLIPVPSTSVLAGQSTVAMDKTGVSVRVTLRLG